jgi:hypothetical protein
MSRFKMTTGRQIGASPSVGIHAGKLRVCAVILALVLVAVVRSDRGTRLDSFTFDEAFHLASGVSYVRTGDFRLNPEHPPLVKLWVSLFPPERVFRLGPYGWPPSSPCLSSGFEGADT